MPTFTHQFFKFNFVVFCAALITFLLFYFMQYLVTVNQGPSQKIFVTKIFDSTTPIFEPVLILNISKPEPIKEFLSPPVESQARVFETGNDNLFNPFLKPPTTPSFGDTNIPLANNVMVPLVRVAASYPSRALRRNIEGVVELSFTVNALGSVEDAEVIYAEPEGYFERSALQTIERWKYSPALNEGKAVPTYDVRQRIVFQIDPASL